jgi:hypothetical protein
MYLVFLGSVAVKSYTTAVRFMEMVIRERNGMEEKFFSETK